MNKKKNTVTLSININAPAQRVWEVISDYGNAQVYNPLVKNVTLLSNNDRGVCAKRRCEFHDESSVVEEVSLWIEEKGFTVNLTETSMPLESAKIHIRVNPKNLFSSDVEMEMNYVVKFGLFGQLLDKIILHRKISQMFNKVLRGLVHYITTNDYLEKHEAFDKNLAFAI